MKISLLATAIALLAATAAPAQERRGGAFVKRGFLGQKVALEPMATYHAGEFKGAHRVAISSFAVAFPSDNNYHAASNIGAFDKLFDAGAKVKMRTSITGVDHATQQRVADKAYALFVAQLQAAGYEVVDRAGLIAAAPEYATWAAVPNFSAGRFGTYVAPTGQSLFWLQGDTDKRDTSGTFGNLGTALRGTESTVAFKRSPYIAHDGNLGILTVTLVVDYGVASSSGETGEFRAARANYEVGVNIAAGNLQDRGSMFQYWGPKSGGFPAIAVLQQPIRTDASIGEVSSIDLSQLKKKDRDFQNIQIKADPAKFEAAANEVVARVVPLFVATMSGSK